jgi:hypothetical protein
MLKHLVGSFCFSLTLLLAACGGGGDSSSASGAATPSAAVSSNVVKGTIKNGVVTLSRWQNGAYVQVASALTDAAGSFNLSVPSPVPGEVLRLDLGLSTNSASPTQMLCDAVACGAASFGQWAPLTTSPGLSSWVSVDANGNAIVMPMTPVSTMLVSYAERIGGGHMDAGSLGVARDRIASLFNVSADDLLVRPGNIANGLWLNAASPAAVKLSLLAAAFAQLSDNSHALESIIQDYSAAFVNNNGHLVQSGAPQSLENILLATQAVISAAGSPAVTTAVSSWISQALGALQSGQLNTAACGTSCPVLDSNRFVDALGTTPNSLGGDLRQVMGEQGVNKLEDLLAKELSKFGWLASSDSVTVAAIAVQTVGYALMGSLDPTTLVPSNGLTPSVSGNTLTIAGTQNGMAVNLTIGLTPIITTMLSSSPVFTYTATGTLSNANVTANIDGSFAIDATGMNFVPVLMSGDPKNLVAFILQTGKAKFTLNGSASLTQISSSSTLAIEGLADLSVNMNGGANGAVTASGAVDHGSLTLPDGSVFSISKNKNEFLTYTLGQDGAFSAKFSALVLNHAADVTATGKLTQLGALLSNLRNQVMLQFNAGTLQLSGIVSQLLTDISSMQLTLNGQATIPDLANHVYTLTYVDGHMQITQPNSTTVAIDVAFSLSGILAQAGGKWWMVGWDFSNLAHPVLTLSDDTGGEWSWSFDFSGLLPVT